VQEPAVIDAVVTGAAVTSAAVGAAALSTNNTPSTYY